MAILKTFSLFFLVLLMCSLLSYGCVSSQKNEVKQVSDLIKREKAQNINAEEQGSNKDDEVDKALAQLFTQLIKKQIQVQGDGDANKLATTEGLLSFIRRIRNSLRNTKRRFKNFIGKIKRFGRKAKRFFHRRRG